MKSGIKPLQITLFLACKKLETSIYHNNTSEMSVSKIFTMRAMKAIEEVEVKFHSFLPRL
jgi:hypothetical protein